MGWRVAGILLWFTFLARWFEISVRVCVGLFCGGKLLWAAHLYLEPVSFFVRPILEAFKGENASKAKSVVGSLLLLAGLYLGQFFFEGILATWICTAIESLLGALVVFVKADLHQASPLRDCRYHCIGVHPSGHWTRSLPILYGQSTPHSLQEKAIRTINPQKRAGERGELDRAAGTALGILHPTFRNSLLAEG